MSEVSLRAAYGAYRNHAASNTLYELYMSIVKGQAEYGYKITHIYSFIDSMDEIQLFYCRDGNTEDLFTSPHVKKRALVWDQNTSHVAPDYLKKGYAEFLLDNDVPEADIAALGLPLPKAKPEQSQSAKAAKPWWKFW